MPEAPQRVAGPHRLRFQPSWPQGAPNDHASDTAKSKVAAHRQNPQNPAQEASVMVGLLVVP